MAAAAVIFVLVAVPATALPITYNFSGKFADGTSATGVIVLNEYGQPTIPTTITTSDGVFSGYTYVVGTDPTNINSVKTTLDLSRLTPHAYDGFLHLVFDHPLTDGTLGSLVIGQSFECSTYDTGTGACGTRGISRLFVDGAAAPEPASLEILGAGLAGIAARRRKRA